MRRKLLMIALGVGAIAGFGSGFARLCHGGTAGWGHSVHRRELERHVADTCVEAALRAHARGSEPFQKPGSGP